MLCCYARRLVVVCMVVVRIRCCHQRIPRSVVAAVVALSVIVRDGSAPPALATVVSGDRRFGRVVDNNNDGSPSQSVSNFDRVATSSSCSSSLLVSVFVVVYLLPKRPAQARVTPSFRVSVAVILRRDAAAVVALPILPPNKQRVDVNHRH